MTVDNLTVITNNVNPDKAGFFESSLFWGVSIWPPFIFQETNLISIITLYTCKQPIQGRLKVSFFSTRKCRKTRKN